MRNSQDLEPTEQPAITERKKSQKPVATARTQIGHLPKIVVEAMLATIPSQQELDSFDFELERGDAAPVCPSCEQTCGVL